MIREYIEHAYHGFKTRAEAEGYVFKEAEWFGKAYCKSQNTESERFHISTQVYRSPAYKHWVGVFKAERKA